MTSASNKQGTRADLLDVEAIPPAEALRRFRAGFAPGDLSRSIRASALSNAVTDHDVTHRHPRAGRRSPAGAHGATPFPA